MIDIDILKPKVVLSASFDQIQILRKIFFYLPVTKASLHAPFFSQEDISSKVKYDSLLNSNNTFVCISSVLFKHSLTDEDLLSLVLKFKQTYFKSRKQVLRCPEHLSVYDFAADSLYDLYEEETETPIIELFDTVGTRAFTDKFLSMSETTNPQVLRKAVLTFLKKLETPSTIFYKKAAQRLFHRYSANYRKSLTQYVLMTNNKLTDVEVALHFIKFHNDIFL